MTGEQLRRFMEWSAAFFKTWKPDEVTIAFDPSVRYYLYDAFEGVSYELDISKEPGHRIKNLKWPNGKAVKDTDMGISKKETRNRVEKLLLTCGLTPEYADRYPHQVSGGECQRAAIARALAVEPRVLICDEATSALDVTVQKQIMELLQKLKKENQLSFLFICHDLALVQLFCDRVIVMHDGHVEEEGTPEEIIEHPKTEYTEQLIRSVL